MQLIKVLKNPLSELNEIVPMTSEYKIVTDLLCSCMSKNKYTS